MDFTGILLFIALSVGLLLSGIILATADFVPLTRRKRFFSLWLSGLTVLVFF